MKTLKFTMILSACTVWTLCHQASWGMEEQQQNLQSLTKDLSQVDEKLKQEQEHELLKIENKGLRQKEKNWTYLKAAFKKQAQHCQELRKQREPQKNATLTKSKNLPLKQSFTVLMKPTAELKKTKEELKKEKEVVKKMSTEITRLYLESSKISEDLKEYRNKLRDAEEQLADRDKTISELQKVNAENLLKLEILEQENQELKQQAQTPKKTIIVQKKPAKDPGFEVKAPAKTAKAVKAPAKAAKAKSAQTPQKRVAIVKKSKKEPKEK